MITAVSQNRFHAPKRQAFGSQMPDQNILDELNKPTSILPRGTDVLRKPSFFSSNLDLKILVSIMPLTMLATGAGVIGSISRIDDTKPKIEATAKPTTKTVAKNTDSLAKAAKSAAHIK